MKKLIYAITIGAITTALLFPTTATTAIKSVRVTGKSVIYDARHAKYTVFFVDNNNYEYVYQVPGKKSNKAMQLFKRSFVNKNITVNLNNKKQITSNLIPWKIVISKNNNNKNS